MQLNNMISKNNIEAAIAKRILSERNKRIARTQFSKKNKKRTRLKLLQTIERSAINATII